MVLCEDPGDTFASNGWIYPLGESVAFVCLGTNSWDSGEPELDQKTVKMNKYVLDDIS